MRLCVHNYPQDRPDLCAGCCLLAMALGVVTPDQARKWWAARLEANR